eukprot:gene6999-10793_t
MSSGTEARILIPTGLFAVVCLEFLSAVAFEPSEAPTIDLEGDVFLLALAQGADFVDSLDQIAENYSTTRNELHLVENAGDQYLMYVANETLLDDTMPIETEHFKITLDQEQDSYPCPWPDRGITWQVVCVRGLESDQYGCYTVKKAAGQNPLILRGTENSLSDALYDTQGAAKVSFVDGVVVPPATRSRRSSRAVDISPRRSRRGSRLRSGQGRNSTLDGIDVDVWTFNHDIANAADLGTPAWTQSHRSLRWMQTLRLAHAGLKLCSKSVSFKAHQRVICVALFLIVYMHLLAEQFRTCDDYLTLEEIVRKYVDEAVLFSFLSSMVLWGTAYLFAETPHSLTAKTIYVDTASDRISRTLHVAPESERATRARCDLYLRHEELTRAAQHEVEGYRLHAALSLLFLAEMRGEGEGAALTPDFEINVASLVAKTKLWWTGHHGTVHDDGSYADQYALEEEENPLWYCALHALSTHDFQLAAALFQLAIIADNPDLFIVFNECVPPATVRDVFARVIGRNAIGRLWVEYYAATFLKMPKEQVYKCLLQSFVTVDELYTMMNTSAVYGPAEAGSSTFFTMEDAAPFKPRPLIYGRLMTRFYCCVLSRVPGVPAGNETLTPEEWAAWTKADEEENLTAECNPPIAPSELPYRRPLLRRRYKPNVYLTFLLNWKTTERHLSSGVFCVTSPLSVSSEVSDSAVIPNPFASITRLSSLWNFQGTGSLFNPFIGTYPALRLTHRGNCIQLLPGCYPPCSLSQLQGTVAQPVTFFCDKAGSAVFSGAPDIRSIVELSDAWLILIAMAVVQDTFVNQFIFVTIYVVGRKGFSEFAAILTRQTDRAARVLANVSTGFQLGHRQPQEIADAGTPPGSQQGSHQGSQSSAPPSGQDTELRSEDLRKDAPANEPDNSSFDADVHRSDAFVPSELPSLWFIADPQIVADVPESPVFHFLNNRMNDIFYTLLAHIMQFRKGPFYGKFVLGDIQAYQFYRDDLFDNVAYRVFSMFAMGAKEDESVLSSDHWADLRFIAGNHDLGYARELRLQNIKRFENTYNQRLWSDTIVFPSDKPPVLLVACDGLELDGELRSNTSWEHLQSFVPGAFSNREGHDHEGCTFIHEPHGTPEWTLRAVQGDYGGNTGVLTIGHDARGSVLLHMEQCPFFTTRLILVAVITLPVSLDLSAELVQKGGSVHITIDHFVAVQGGKSRKEMAKDVVHHNAFNTTDGPPATTAALRHQHPKRAIITIDTSNSRYNVVRHAAAKLGWDEANPNAPAKVVWVDTSISLERVLKLPDGSVDSARHLMKLKRQFGSLYKFVPSTFLNYDEYMRTRTRPQRLGTSLDVRPQKKAVEWYIVKPDSGCRAAEYEKIMAASAERSSLPAPISAAATSTVVEEVTHVLELPRDRDLDNLRKVTHSLRNVLKVLDKSCLAPKNQQACLLGTPFVPYIVVIGLCWWVYSVVTIDAKYYENVRCPVVERLSALTKQDPVLFYYFKSSLARTCDSEDSLWRYFTDAWVKTVVTESDSWYLLLIQFQSVFVGTAVVFVAAPIFSLIFVVPGMLCQTLELSLNLAGAPWTRVERILLFWESIVCLPVLLFVLLCRSSPLPFVLRGFKEQLYTGDNLLTAIEESQKAITGTHPCYSASAANSRSCRKARSFKDFHGQGEAIIQQGTLLLAVKTEALRLLKVVDLPTTAAVTTVHTEHLPSTEANTQDLPASASEEEQQNCSNVIAPVEIKGLERSDVPPDVAKLLLELVAIIRKKKAQEAVKACASHEKMKEALEGFWHIKIIRKYLPELLMVHEVKVFRKLWEYSRDIAGPIKKQEVVSSLVLAHKEFKDSINGLRDRLLHPNICDMVVSKDDLQYCSEEALNAIANITGRPTSNIDALVTHEKHLRDSERTTTCVSCLQNLRDLPDVDSKVVEAKLPELDELRKDLMNAGGRDMRRLESIAKTGRVVITTVTKDGLSVCVKDVLTLKYLSESASSILPQQEILSYSAWDEFLTKITLGFTNLEDTFKMNRDSANSLLQAARAAALKLSQVQVVTGFPGVGKTKYIKDQITSNFGRRRRFVTINGDCLEDSFVMPEKYVGLEEPDDASLYHLLCNLRPSDPIVTSYLSRRVPPTCSGFMWTRELVEVMLELDLWFAERTPVILEGETGSGKTFLVNCWCALRSHRLRAITIHGGYDMDRISREMRTLLDDAFRYYTETRKRTVIFLDEMNTSPAVDLLKELVCEFRINGETLAHRGDQGFVTFVGAINPDRKRSAKELERYRHQGLQVLSGNGTNLAEKVYRVHGQPEGILADTMAGRSSSDPFIQQFPQLTLRVLQCSPHTTAADLDEHFKASEDDSDTTSRNVVVLEEAGLAEMSPEMPLKLLHEKFDEKPRACVCMSNWNVDPAKMNRGLFVTRSTPSEDDLLVTAKLFAGARQHVFAEYLEGLSTGFRKASDLMGRKSEFPEGAFYALRDYYSTVALLVSIADPSAASVKSVVHRNFSGLPHAAQLEVDRVFQNVMKVAPRVFSLDSTFDDIRSAIGLADGKITPEGPSVDGRYPMIINSSVTATLEFLEKSKLLPAGEHGYEVICGSGFPADTGLEYTKGLIARIKPVLGSGKALVLLNANTSYESLYDLFNRYYTQYGDQKMVDVGLGRTKIKRSERREDIIHDHSSGSGEEEEDEAEDEDDQEENQEEDLDLATQNTENEEEERGEYDDEYSNGEEEEPTDTETDPLTEAGVEQLALLLAACDSDVELAKSSLLNLYEIPADYEHTSLEALLLQQQVNPVIQCILKCQPKACVAIVAVGWDEGWLRLAWGEGAAGVTLPEAVLKHLFRETSDAVSEYFVAKWPKTYYALTELLECDNMDETSQQATSDWLAKFSNNAARKKIVCSSGATSSGQAGATTEFGAFVPANFLGAVSSSETSQPFEACQNVSVDMIHWEEYRKANNIAKGGRPGALMQLIAQRFPCPGMSATGGIAVSVGAFGTSCSDNDLAPAEQFFPFAAVLSSALVSAVEDPAALKFASLENVAVKLFATSSLPRGYAHRFLRTSVSSSIRTLLQNLAERVAPQIPAVVRATEAAQIVLLHLLKEALPPTATADEIALLPLSSNSTARSIYHLLSSHSPSVEEPGEFPDDHEEDEETADTTDENENNEAGQTNTSYHTIHLLTEQKPNDAGEKHGVKLRTAVFIPGDEAEDAARVVDKRCLLFFRRIRAVSSGHWEKTGVLTGSFRPQTHYPRGWQPIGEKWKAWARHDWATHRRARGSGSRHRWDVLANAERKKADAQRA